MDLPMAIRITPDTFYNLLRDGVITVVASNKEGTSRIIVDITMDEQLRVALSEAIGGDVQGVRL
jgi:hypothetical protein